MPVDDPLTTVLILAAFLAGGVVKGALGFGLPLVTISVLPFLIPVEAAIAINAVVITVVNAVQAGRSGRIAEAARIAVPVLAGLAIATPVAVAVATAMPRALLTGIVGAFVLAFATVSLAGTPRLGSAPPGRLGGFGLGIAGGVVGAMSSTPGPVFVMGLTAAGLERTLFMAVLGVLMGAVGVALVLSLWSAGVLDAARLGFGLACIVPALAGFRLGDAVGRRIPVGAFRRAVLGLLAVLGLAMLVRAAGAA